MVKGLRPGPEEAEFEQSVADALDLLPADLRDYMSNVAILVEDEPPPDMPLLGLYQGLPLTKRGSRYAGVAPDKITIFRRPLERLYGGRDRYASRFQAIAAQHGGGFVPFVQEMPEVLARSRAKTSEKGVQ